MARAKPLFEFGEYESPLGFLLPYRINCSSLKQADLECIARCLHPQLDAYSKVVAASPGSERLAKIFEQWINPDCRTLLVVDDEWVCGKSMQPVLDAELKKGKFTDWQGVVIVARSRPTIRIRYFLMAMV